MQLITTFLIAVGVAMDVFAVSLGMGTTGKTQTPRSIFRVAFHCGLFQGLMTFLGWLAGSTVANLIDGVDHWVAMGLLGFVGYRMIRSGFDPAYEPQSGDPSRGGTLMMVCIATSIDALAVGLSLSLIRVNILQSSLIIGIVTAAFGVVGLLAGSGLGLRFGKRMEVFGGVLLTLIGLRILFSSLL